jgi:hypothetical protein
VVLEPIDYRDNVNHHPNKHRLNCITTHHNRLLRVAFGWNHSRKDHVSNTVDSRRVECTVNLAVVCNTAIIDLFCLIIAEFTLEHIVHFMIKLCAANIMNTLPFLLDKVYLGFLIFKFTPRLRVGGNSNLSLLTHASKPLLSCYPR